MMYGSSVTYRTIASWGAEPAPPHDAEALEWRSDGIWFFRVRRGGETWTRLQPVLRSIPADLAFYALYLSAPANRPAL